MMTVSAPGKLMLMGEHAVVYGYPCIVSAISERLYVTDTPNGYSGDMRFIDAAIKFWGKPKMLLFATSAFSRKYGFGSSSAVTVAALKALRPDATNREIFESAYKIVLDIQGVGSGFDVAAATYGKTLLYVKGGVTLEELPWNLNTNGVSLVIGYSGVKADTASIVKDVARKRNEQKERVDRIFEATGKLVMQAKVAGDKGDWETVGKLMNFNQEYLRDLGVSTEKLEEMIAAAKKSGAYGAKLSGAGGGDCMIAPVPKEKREAVEQAIASCGQLVNVTVHAEGVRVHTTDDQSEQFIVVDEQDNILGYKSRYECHHNKSLIHRTVGTAIFNTKNELLLLKRSKTKDLGAGLWDVSSAGHVNKNESYEQAARRELFEELGIENPLIFHSKTIFSDSDETEMQVLFTTKYDGKVTTNKEEIEDIIYIQPSQLPRKILAKEIRLSSWAEHDLKKLHIL